MADTTNPLPSVSEPFVDRFRRINPVWLRWLKPLLETVKTTTTQVTTVTSEVNDVQTTVTQIQSSVDGLEGQWGVSVDVNNKVIGLVRLDGGATGSTFTVLADKFIVRHPTTTTDIQAFIVGLVNGVSTVGINGNLVVDDTILARHIDVSSLSSITANIGTVTAGVVRSSDSKFVIDLDNKTIDIVP